MTEHQHKHEEKKEKRENSKANIEHVHAQQNTQSKEDKEHQHEEKHVPKHESSNEHKDKTETKEQKPEHKEIHKPQEIKEKKTEAIARGTSLPLSKKHCMYIFNFIKNKGIDLAIYDLERVIKYQQAVPFKGEIPHRKGKIMSGRYPIKASGILIKVLKGLKGNAISQGLDIDKTRITFASANWAPRPSRSQGRHAKRTHVLLKAKEISK